MGDILPEPVGDVGRDARHDEALEKSQQSRDHIEDGNLDQNSANGGIVHASAGARDLRRYVLE